METFVPGQSTEKARLKRVKNQNKRKQRKQGLISPQSKAKRQASDRKRYMYSHSSRAIMPSIMGLNYNVVQGNFHQNNHHLFGEHSAGRQCTCNGLCALALNEIFPCCFWAADDLDTLLYAGDALYSHITRAVDEPGYLLLSELPDEFRFQDSLFRAHFGDSCYGLVNENCEGFPDLGVSLNNIFAQHTTCLLTVNFYTITLLKDVSLSQFFCI